MVQRSWIISGGYVACLFLAVLLQSPGASASSGCEYSTFLEPPYNGTAVSGSTYGYDGYSGCQLSGSAAVFYAIMPSYGGEVTVSTCGSASFNTLIVLLDGPDCDHLNCLMDSMSEGDECIGVGSSITFTARQQYYYVMVTGQTQGSEGDFTLTISTGLPAMPLPCPGTTLVTDALNTPLQLSGDIEVAGAFEDVASLDEFQTSSLIFQQIQTSTQFPAFYNQAAADEAVPGGSRVLSVEVYYSPPYSPVISSVGFGDWGVTTAVNSAVMTRLLYFGEDALDGDGTFVQTGLGGYDATFGGTVNAFRFEGFINSDADLIVSCIDMNQVAGSVGVPVLGVANTRSYVVSFDDLQPAQGPKVDFTNLGSIIFAFVCGGDGMQATWDYFSFANWVQPTAITYNVCEISNNHFTMDWYELHLTSNATVTASTCNAQTTFPTDIAVLTGGCPSFECMGVVKSPCSNVHFENGQEIAFLPTVPEGIEFVSYFIAISTADIRGGHYVMELAQAESSDDDGITCDRAIPLITGMTTLATAGEVYENICGLDTNSPSLWFSYAAPAVGSLILSTCSALTDFDTVLVVVDSCQSLSCIAANDDTPCDWSVSGASAVSVNMSAGQEIFIAVAGYQAEQGTFQLVSSFIAA